VSWLGRLLIAVVVLAGGMLQALGQAPGPGAGQGAGPDAAVLAKANAGDAAAQVQAGESYAAAHDLKQAAAWYRKAAEQGDAGAQGTLGMLYTLGQGVQRSDVEAYYWLDLAAAVKGPKQEQYAANRQNVGTRITADELEAVQDREAAWKAAHPRPNAAE
jgi:TPR repeat protein